MPNSYQLPTVLGVLVTTTPVFTAQNAAPCPRCADLPAIQMALDLALDLTVQCRIRQVLQPPSHLLPRLDAHALQRLFFFETILSD
jgi:hypothetical protein